MIFFFSFFLILHDGAPRKKQKHIQTGSTKRRIWRPQSTRCRLSENMVWKVFFNPNSVKNSSSKKKKKKKIPTYLPYFCSTRYANITIFFLALFFQFYRYLFHLSLHLHVFCVPWWCHHIPYCPLLLQILMFLSLISGYPYASPSGICWRVLLFIYLFFSVSWNIGYDSLWHPCLYERIIVCVSAVLT